MSKKHEKLQLYAVCAPGLEACLAQELTALNLFSPSGPDAVQQAPGGIEFSGDLTALYTANLRLRTASRVLVRLGDFYATGFPELIRKAERLPWERYLRTNRPVALRVTCHKSRLYHSGAVTERLAQAISSHLGSPITLEKASEEDEPTQAQLIVARLANDQCLLSIDSSGELLHRRGYRLATAKAPLRETLAAGLLYASGWDQRSPLIDPFCGSGTLPIEAAQMAAGIAPGAQRRFSFMEWPGYQSLVWKSVLAAVPVPDLSSLPPILGSDRDAGAVSMAQANATRAGVGSAVNISQRAVSAIEPPPGPGWVVTNPPYGVRVQSNKDLRNLYAQLGNVLRQHCPGWRFAVFCPDELLLGQMRLPIEQKIRFTNGGLPVKLAIGVVG